MAKYIRKQKILSPSGTKDSIPYSILQDEEGDDIDVTALGELKVSDSNAASMSIDTGDIKTATEATASNAASIKTSVELIDDAIGTHDDAAPSKLIVEGGYAESTVPDAVSDGDAVRIWLDTYGRQVSFADNLSVNAKDTNVINQALLNTIEVTLLDGVTASGASSSIDVRNFNKFTFDFQSTSVSTGSTIKIQGSLDNTNWYDIHEEVIAANGITYAVISDEKHKYIRANVTSYTDGTYSVLLFGGN